METEFFQELKEKGVKETIGEITIVHELSMVKASASLKELVLCWKGKLINAWNEGDLEKDRKYDESRQGDGFGGSHENPGNKRVLRVEDLRNRNSNDFRIGKQVEKEYHQEVKDNVVSQGRASSYENLKRPRSRKRYFLVRI